MPQQFRIARPCILFLLPSVLLASVLFACVASDGLAAVTVGAEEGEVSYFKQVRPLFQSQCHGCHQPAKKLGQYEMTSFTLLLKGGESGNAAIVPGKPEESYLLEQITPIDGTAEMPKKSAPFSTLQVSLVRRWIQQGAINDAPSQSSAIYTLSQPPMYTRPPVINSLDYSPDGTLLAVSGFHEVMLFDANGDYARPNARLIGMSPRIEAVRFSPDGALLAAVGGTAAIAGEVQIWDVQSKTLKLSVPVGNDTLYGVSWSPDGKRLAFGCSDSSVRVIDAEEGTQVLYQGSHNDWVFDTVFSQDGRHLVSVSRDQTAKLIEVETQRFVDNITSITPKALKGGIQSVVRHPFRDAILFGGADGTPKIYQMQRTTARKIGDDANQKWLFPPLPGRIFSVDISRDGGKVVAGSSLNGKGAVHLYGIDPAYEIPKDISDILVTPTHSRSREKQEQLATFFADNVQTLAQNNYPTAIYAVAFHPSGDQVAAAGGDGHVRLLNSANGDLLNEFVPVEISPPKTTQVEKAVSAEAETALQAKPVSDSFLKQITSIVCEPRDITLVGKDAYCQMVVMASTKSGEQVDVTRLVKVSFDRDIAECSSVGLVTPVCDGESRYKIVFGDLIARGGIEISGATKTQSPDFIQDVMPVISRMGCNAGTCHGSKDGKNGFKLSLRGYDPLYDVRAFTDDIGSRRVNLASPENSLLLQKCTATVPHEGGQLTQRGSSYYQIVHDWIADGAELHLDSPGVISIQVTPKNPVVQKIGSRQQIRVTAQYADGKTRDVTREAFISSANTDIAKPVSGHAGLIAVERRGESPLLVRFEGSYAATTVTVMGERSEFEWQQPPSNGPIDDLVYGKLLRTKTSAAPLCDDYEFVRRIHLDLTGLPPSATAIRQFVDDPRDSRWKRDELIDQLIGCSAYVDHWANKWADLLQVNSKFLGSDGARRFRAWIRENVAENRPYDQFVYDILTATGSNYDSPAASYFKILRTPEDAMENTTHLFLATRFNCNKCHDHPFERWTQDQYYEMAAFFAQVGLKKDERSGDKTIGKTAVESGKPLYEEVFDRVTGEVKHDRTGEVTAPNTPYAAKPRREIGPDASRREKLAVWITSPENQYFAKSYVNRLWGYLTGTGVIEPIDDIRAGNPATNPQLLAYLTQRFLDEEFDVQAIVREICKSRTYQLSIDVNRWNRDDRANYSHAKARRLPAEVLYDAIQSVTGSESKFPNVPAGTRAAALPDVGIKLPDGFLGNLGRPARESACECERSNDVQLGSVMALVNGPTVGEAIAGKNNALAKLVAEQQDDKALFQELFLRILNRPATDSELATAQRALSSLDSEHEKLGHELEKAERHWKPVEAALQAKRWQAITKAEKALNQYLGRTEAARNAAATDRENRIEAAEKALAQYESELDLHLNEWEASESRATRWSTVKLDALSSSAEATFETLEDGSVFVSGENARGNYGLDFTVGKEAVTGIRIEALTDSRLPKKGPGRAKDGNFVISELKLQWSDLLNPSEAELTRWEFEQGNEGWTANGQLALANIDGHLRLSSSGNDPQFIRRVNFEGGPFMLEVQARLKGKAESQLFWTTPKAAEFSEVRSVRLALAGTGAWENYRYYFNARHALSGLRFDPQGTPGEMEIRSMRLVHVAEANYADVALQDARADFSQQGYAVSEAINGQNKESDDGWAISPKIGESHRALFVLEKPLDQPVRKKLRLKLMQNYRSNEHSLGRFRISVTSDTPPVGLGLPIEIAKILAVAGKKRTEQQAKTLRNYFRETDSQMAAYRDQLKAAKQKLPIASELQALEDQVAVAHQPIKVDPALQRLRGYFEVSKQQLKNKRLTAAQDVAWALINSPAFLFNH